MSNATQFQFELNEVAKMLLRKQGIKEGKWTLGIAFNVAAAHAGPTAEQARPSMIVGVDKIVLAKAESITPESAIVDASTLTED
jgi:hypothetical protein